MNEQIINEFEKLIHQIVSDYNSATDKAEEKRHSYRLAQIRKAYYILKKFPTEIKSSNDIKGIKGIAKGVMSRVDEILTTGKLSEVMKSSNKNVTNKSISELEEVIGIGKTYAKKLVIENNIKSVKELKDKYKKGEIELNDQIALGLKYYDKLNTEIEREKMDKINKFIRKAAKRVDKSLKAKMCGSYRRKKPISHDIDILLVHPDVEVKSQVISNNYLIKFIEYLKKKKFLVDDLTGKNPKTKYMGFCKYEKSLIRIDIRFVAVESYYTALIYFTGSGAFNIELRKKAHEKGLVLNEYGLFKNDKSLPISSEKDIFDIIGIEYVEPANRDK